MPFQIDVLRQRNSLNEIIIMGINDGVSASPGGEVEHVHRLTDRDRREKTRLYFLHGTKNSSEPDVIQTLDRLNIFFYYLLNR